LARIGEFRALYLSQLEKTALEFPWHDTLPSGALVSVETACHKSKIYHAGAATQRVEEALVANDFFLAPAGTEGSYSIRVRIDRDIVTMSLDTSGEPLYKRGHKQAVNKAPMRETMASMFLRDAGFNGKEALYDPMCGSGTFVIEAAEIARRFDCGRARTFAFQTLPTFDAEAFAAMGSPDRPAAYPCFGSDRDQGAIKMSIQNAERAGVDDVTSFHHASISDIAPPTDAAGLVICNPPYGARLGNKTPLVGLYALFGEPTKHEFKGSPKTIVPSEPRLPNATNYN